MASRKILIVEDEEDISQLLEYNLQKRGFQVYWARAGEAGLNVARKRKIDLVILDLILPDMDGFEFCKIIRKETEVPIVFLTGAKNDICRKLCFELGANDYVTKPFSIDDLMFRIEELLLTDSVSVELSV